MAASIAADVESERAFALDPLASPSVARFGRPATAEHAESQAGPTLSAMSDPVLVVASDDGDETMADWAAVGDGQLSSLI